MHTNGTNIEHLNVVDFLIKIAGDNPYCSDVTKIYAINARHTKCTANATAFLARFGSILTNKSKNTRSICL